MHHILTKKKKKKKKTNSHKILISDKIFFKVQYSLD